MQAAASKAVDALLADNEDDTKASPRAGRGAALHAAASGDPVSAVAAFLLGPGPLHSGRSSFIDDDILLTASGKGVKGVGRHSDQGGHHPGGHPPGARLHRPSSAAGVGECHLGRLRQLSVDSSIGNGAGSLIEE